MLRTGLTSPYLELGERGLLMRSTARSREKSIEDIRPDDMMNAKPIYGTPLGLNLGLTCVGTWYLAFTLLCDRQLLISFKSPSMMDLQDDLSSTDVGSPELEGNVSQETSTTKASFSSLIDYNPQGSSLASQHASSSPPEMPESLLEPSIKSVGPS
jgi:hypothetical protein